MSPLNSFYFLIFCVLQLGAVLVQGQGLPDGFSDDVSNFYANSDEKTKELKEFIDANSSKANDLDVGYLLFTPDNPKFPFSLERSKKSLYKSFFNPNLDTVIFIHGYLFDIEFPNDIKFETKDRILEYDDYNVIVVNYTKYNKGLLSQAVFNGYIVAQNIANTMQFLMDNTGIDSTKFHLVGHSMGGNVAGYVGTLIQNIGRITGLDSSGPIYDKLPPKYRLTYKSANFVDDIHTNKGKTPAQGNGIYFPIGHQDFYVNGGGPDQPGCEFGDTMQMENLENKTISDPFKKMLCSHERSEFLFMESVLDCKFIGVKCSSDDDMENGDCDPNNSETAVMGFHAKKIPNIPPKAKFYVKTTSQPLYCEPDDEDSGGMLSKGMNLVKSFFF